MHLILTLIRHYFLLLSFLCEFHWLVINDRVGIGIVAVYGLLLVLTRCRRLVQTLMALPLPATLPSHACAPYIGALRVVGVIVGKSSHVDDAPSTTS